MSQRPLELILARNLMTALSTPAFLVDEGGLLVFYNEAAGMLLGKRFEELGSVGPQEWGAIFGPFDETGEPIPYDELPLVVAVRNGRPAHADFEIRSIDGARHTVEASAFPILTAHGTRGAIAVFWPAAGGDGGDAVASSESKPATPAGSSESEQPTPVALSESKPATPNGAGA